MLEIYDKTRRRVAIAENACNMTEDRKINSIWYFHFSLPYNDPKNDYCQAFNYVRYNGGELYRIMPAAAQISQTGYVTYQCEHVLAALIDNVLFGYHVVGNRGVYTKDCISYVLSQQGTPNWVLYECDFSRQFEYGWEQETLLSALFSIATPLDDYMWVTDTAVYPWRLSLKRIDRSGLPELYIRAKWNMLSYGDNSDPQQICTRLYPLGYGEGVNQLTIKSVNNGVPYLESPQSYIDQYGIIERVWIDRRYEDPESLMAAAQVMLDELQEPLRSYEIGFAELDTAEYNKAAIGKRVRILYPELEKRVDTIVTEMAIKYDNIPSSTITVANRSTSIASSVADMADRQRIEQTYAQGATQLFAQSVQANATVEKSAKLNFYIPSEMRIVNAVKLKVQLSAFRSYSKATEGGGANTFTSSAGGGNNFTSSAGGSTTVSSADGGSTTVTSASGGNTTLTSAGGGGINATSAAGGGGTQTSAEGGGGNTTSAAGGGASVTSDAGGGFSKTSTYNGKATGNTYSEYGSSGGYTGYADGEGSHRHYVGIHHHGFETADHTHTVEVQAHNHTVNIGTHTHSVSIGAHSHSVTLPTHTHTVTAPEHTHSVSLPGHTHSVSIGSHTHSVSIGNHTHQVEIRDHTHNVNIPNHTHGIIQGIFEFGAPSAAKLYVNGKLKASVGSNAELDITQYLVSDSGMITRGQWNTIELLPDDLAYITIDITVQGFVQSRGDNTV